LYNQIWCYFLSFPIYLFDRQHRVAPSQRSGLFVYCSILRTFGLLRGFFMEKLHTTVDFLRQKIGDFQPQVGIILGTGLGSLVNDIAIETALSYADIPHFPISTVESHPGRLIFGHLSGKKVVCMQGRFHYYEGYSLDEVVFPVRVMRLLGADTLLISNAAGGLNPAYQKSDLVLLHDHIGLLLPGSPLRGQRYASLGDRFPDMSEPYDVVLRNRVKQIAQQHQIVLHEGVYVVVQGPQLETRAEYRMLRQWGADVVGMSTVPEVIAAIQVGMRVLGLSVVTDMCIPESLEKAALADIIAAAQRAEPALTLLFRELIAQMD
jgi:purine-nucleoside phosphorylase